MWRTGSLGLAGAVSAAGLAVAAPAGAEPRTITVTLLGGQPITITVDVPPGTPLDQITLPPIIHPILSVREAAGAGRSRAGAAPAPAQPQRSAAKHRRSSPRARRRRRAQATQRAARRPATLQPPAARAAAQPGDGASARRGRRSADGSADPTFSYAIPGPAPVGVPNFFIDKFRIPPFLLPIYQAAGIQYGVRWEILAAINEIETDYGRNVNVSSAGALGWMQFMPATWRSYGVDANDDEQKDPYNPVDAIFAAARYLKAAGADGHQEARSSPTTTPTGTSTAC